VKVFLPRRMIHECQLGLIDLEEEGIWTCVTCKMCVDRCPRGVDLISIMRALRRLGVEWRAVPSSLRTSLTSISTLGNPWGEAKEKRYDWARDLGIKDFSPGTEWLLFPCCTPCYDPRARRMAVNFVEILKKAGVDFGVIRDEVCCGESARKSGEEALFQNLKETNKRLFEERGVKKIITISPHCYFTFNNEYDGDFEVVHYSEFLSSLIRDGAIKPKAIGGKVAYHDPCYLGRHSGIYDEPREVLRSLGVELIELPDSRENSLCCGGGGGRIWMETPKGERFSDIRVEQALSVGADTIALACPYCMVMIEDSVLSMGKELKVKDLSELVNEAL